MPEAFLLTCSCGAKIEVTSASAGSHVECQVCNEIIAVPSLAALNASSQTASLRDLVYCIQTAAKEGSAPFDGICHACNYLEADVRVPVKLLYRNRQDQNDGVARELSNAIGAPAANANPSYLEIGFPLLFCEFCHTDYQRTQASLESKILAALAVIGILICMASVRVTPIGVILVALTPIAFYLDRKTKDKAQREMLAKVPYVHGLLARVPSFLIVEELAEEIVRARESSSVAFPADKEGS